MYVLSITIIRGPWQVLQRHCSSGSALVQLAYELSISGVPYSLNAREPASAQYGLLFSLLMVFHQEYVVCAAAASHSAADVIHIGYES